ncbi:MAG: DUF726 domain-containing protein [Paucimonas sp.]|nr:DUF726 domain-containing protein [Paucimonas sp.]
MDKHFKFLTLPHDERTVANVFVHGYSAGHDLRDRRELASHIPATLHNGINIFAFWRSGHILDLGGNTIASIVGALRASPYAAIGALAVDRVKHFVGSRSDAEKMGAALFDELRDYLAVHHPKVTTINLVGHSLGGRVLVSTLRTLVREPTARLPRIRDVLLMAAAVEVSAQEAARLKACIDGELINAWSKSDSTLLLCVDESCLGRREVEHFKNVAMDGFGHKDYWPKLHQVLTASGFAGFRGQHYPAVKDGAAAQPEDPVRRDYLLHDLLELSPSIMLDEASKHLATSSWTSLDHEDRLYGFTREFQLVAGHCLVNLARRRGLPYAEALEMLINHFDLGKALHHCGTILEVEAALVRTFFLQHLPGNPVLQGDVLSVVKGMSAQDYFRHVDALAERLTLGALLKSPASAEGGQSLVPSGTAAMTNLAFGNWTGLIASRVGTSVGRTVTHLMTAVKPGYSALIPTVAIIFYARAKLGNRALTI